MECCLAIKKKTTLWYTKYMDESKKILWWAKEVVQCDFIYKQF